MNYAEILADDLKYELIAGVTYMMAPPNYRHNMIAGNIYRIISTYLRGKRCKAVYETMVYFDENNKFIPDLAVVCDRKKIKANGIHGAPDLVIEIISPSTQKRDMGVKQDSYEKFGVKEYWLVNPRDKSITVYLLRDGKYKLDNVYIDWEPEDWNMLDDKEQQEQKFTLKISLYDDLEIHVKEIFEE